MVKKLVKRLKNHFKEVIRIKTSPHSIAIGFAIGTLIAILPTPGLSIILGLLVVLIFERVSKIALFGALIVWNPIVLTPIYILSFNIGDLIFGQAPVVDYKISFLDRIYNFSRRYLVGNAILAAIISAASYFIVKTIAARYQKRKL